MHRVLAVIALLAASFVCLAQEPKGRLPAHWTKLGLSQEQTKKVYSIQAESAKTIDKLEAELAKAKQDERKLLLEVLTDAQKKLLAEILLRDVK